MRTTLLFASAAALVVAAPAAAQDLGLGGRVGGGVSGQVEPPGQMVRDTVRDTGQLARDAARDARDAARDAELSARARAEADARARAQAGPDGASASAEVEAGLTLRTRDGETVGEIVEVTRNTAGQATRILVRTADGAVRSLPPAGVSVEGDAAVTNYSGAQVRGLPAETDDTRRDPHHGGEGRID